MRETVGERAVYAIKQSAKARGIKHGRELEQLGIPPHSFYEWKNNGNPSAYYLGEMAKAGYDVYWILTGEKKVVHGRWEPREDAPGFVRCSACRNCNTYDEWLDGKKWAYCPECGAKMDSEG